MCEQNRENISDKTLQKKKKKKSGAVQQKVPR